MGPGLRDLVPAPELANRPLAVLRLGPEARLELGRVQSRGDLRRRIVEELEGVFRGAGWNVIKVLWGTKWDELLAADTWRKEAARELLRAGAARVQVLALARAILRKPELLILDAESLSEPIATVPLKNHIPHGFHGGWTGL